MPIGSQKTRRSGGFFVEQVADFELLWVVGLEWNDWRVWGVIHT